MYVYFVSYFHTHSTILCDDEDPNDVNQRMVKVPVTMGVVCGACVVCVWCVCGAQGTHQHQA